MMALFTTIFGYHVKEILLQCSFPTLERGNTYTLISAHIRDDEGFRLHFPLERSEFIFFNDFVASEIQFGLFDAMPLITNSSINAMQCLNIRKSIFTSTKIEKYRQVLASKCVRFLFIFVL